MHYTRFLELRPVIFDFSRIPISNFDFLLLPNFSDSRIACCLKRSIDLIETKKFSWRVLEFEQLASCDPSSLIRPNCHQQL